MFRNWKTPLIAMLAAGTFFVSMPAASAAQVSVTPVAWRGGFRAGWGGGWRGGWYGPGWGWGAGWYGPGWYGGYYYSGPPAGKVKIDTPDKAAAIFVDGGYVGTVASARKFPLSPGAHSLEVRDPSGRVLFNQNVQIIRGHTTELHVG